MSSPHLILLYVKKEVKMSGMRKRSELDNQKKTFERTDRVTVLGVRNQSPYLSFLRSPEKSRTRKMMSAGWKVVDKDNEND